MNPQALSPSAQACVCPCCSAPRPRSFERVIFDYCEACGMIWLDFPEGRPLLYRILDVQPAAVTDFPVRIRRRLRRAG